MHCLRSAAHRPNWELIVVNNGSTDGTGDYLAGVQDASPVPVTVIANATNRGFPTAINQGLQFARGEYLVLLNNDVVVTDGWLRQLDRRLHQRVDRSRMCINAESTESTRNGGFDVGARAVRAIHIPAEYHRHRPCTASTSRLMKERGRIGLVGPMSNYAAPPQLVEDVPYRDLDEMKDFARRWREDHRGTVVHREEALGVLLAHEAGGL